MSRDQMAHALGQVIRDLMGDESHASLYRRMFIKQITDGVPDDVVSDTTLTNAIKGERLPDFVTLRQIAGAFDMEAWELMKKAESLDEAGSFLAKGGARGRRNTIKRRVNPEKSPSTPGIKDGLHTIRWNALKAAA